MKIPILLFSLFVLVACAGSLSQRQQRAFELADAAGMSGFVAPGELPLQGFRRIDAPGEPVWVFIEGDGLAWVTPTRPSRDPTPLTPVALQLAAVDPATNRVYLARPGQYQKTLPSSRYWLAGRFAEPVIQAMTTAVKSELKRAQSSQLVLVGYSGGGAVAALLAQHLIDHPGITVQGLITVAGNLDHDYWTTLKGLSPLQESLNPADGASSLATLPQRHLLGELDDQVPARVVHAFLDRLPDQRCVELIAVPLPHAGPWQQVWQESRTQRLQCKAEPLGRIGCKAGQGAFVRI